MLSFRECESFNCSCPSGLTISHHDGRMYISELCDSLTVREIDGSQSELSLRPGPNKEFFNYICYARICSDDRIVVQDESGNLIKYSNDGEFIWRIESETTSRTVSFCLDSSDLIYCATSNEVKVYLPSGTLSHVLVSDLKHPGGIAIDGDSNVPVWFLIFYPSFQH